MIFSCLSASKVAQNFCHLLAASAVLLFVLLFLYSVESSLSGTLHLKCSKYGFKNVWRGDKNSNKLFQERAGMLVCQSCLQDLLQVVC